VSRWPACPSNKLKAQYWVSSCPRVALARVAHSLCADAQVAPDYVAGMGKMDKSGSAAPHKK